MVSNKYFFFLLLALFAINITLLAEPEKKQAKPIGGIKVESGIGRVDLIWQESEDLTIYYEIQRSKKKDSGFERINEYLWTTNVYSDYIGKSKGKYYYRIRSIHPSKNGRSFKYSDWSPVVSGTPKKGNLNTFYTEIQRNSFRYFYHFAHPVSGLAREKTPFRKVKNPEDIKKGNIKSLVLHRRLCTTGATGMGMFNLVVGSERKFITRKQAAKRALKILKFLSEKAERFHGAYSHWLFGDTGKTKYFSGKEDNGADIVETAFLAEGFIVLREYFDKKNSTEKAVRKLADKLWKEIEWDWFVNKKGKKPYLIWHWSPDYGWEKNLAVRGFNECQIAYILALASPTHPIKPISYQKGWIHKRYGIDRTAFGVHMELGRGPVTPPLFFMHYSYLGFDPKTISYKGTTYFDHFTKWCEAQVKYAESKKDIFKGYGPLWGLTASADPKGYTAHQPETNDNGTITPTAAVASIPYLPDESKKCMITMYKKYGKKVWGDFGFIDAFNLTEDWYAPTTIGIDVGPIAPMIENYRTGLCWKIFMKAPEIQKAVKILQDPEIANGK